MKKILYIITTIVLFSSCKKFLDIEPKGKVILSQIDDFDLWLNNRNLAITGAAELNYLSDLIDDFVFYENEGVRTEVTGQLAYLWGPQFNTGASANASPLFWGTHYENIYKFNAVISGIDKAPGDENIKQKLKAEAKLGRALEYLYLINLFGNVYDPATATSDKGVPIVETIDVSKNDYKSTSVKEVYDFILKDLTEAIPSLPENNSSNRFRGSAGAAQSVLARTYLYMGNYDLAQKAAEAALNLSKTQMLDYNTMEDLSGVQHISVSNFNIYARRSNSTTDSRKVTLDYINSMDRNDRRYTFFYVMSDGYSVVSKDSLVFHQRGSVTQVPYGSDGSFDFTNNFGTTAAEMKLIIMECEARLDQIGSALNTLNEFKRLRYDTDSLQTYTNTNKEALLNEIFNERKLELGFSGLRWFDMRRLDKEGKMPPVSRYFTDNGTKAITTLTANDPRYTLQIPNLVKEFNPNL